MPLADLGGLRLHYDEAGQGSAALLIMGFGMPGIAWSHQVPTLSERHRVIWFDNRGSGRSAAPPGPYTIPQLAGDAISLLDALEVDRAHIIGVSMGGMIAQELALRYRRRVRSLTLIATHPGGRLAWLPPLAGIRHFLGAQVGPNGRRRYHLERMLFPEAFLAVCDREWLDAVLTRDFGSRPSNKARRAQLSAVRHHDTRGRLAQLRGVPTLIVRPSRDRLVDPKHSVDLHHRIPGSRLVHFEEAGHGVIRQEIEPLNALLLEHMAEAE